MKWPDGKSFAFTIFDDTDKATLENVKPVYSLLADLGIRITKSVWPLNGTQPDINQGDTLEDISYRNWVLDLRQQGFEIGYHMASWNTSGRDKTRLALKRFEEILGAPPSVMANHSRCQENIYWGPARLTGVRKLIYNTVTLGKHSGKYRGHIKNDPLFWGDLCRDKIKYVRGFTSPGINTLRDCPHMPYHDPERPFVNLWFGSAQGPNVTTFNQLLSESNQDKLESESGACIVYTHFGAGFYENGKLNSRFEELIKKLVQRGGWFVPVTELLDYLLKSQGAHNISNNERSRMEWQWLRHKLLKGRS